MYIFCFCGWFIFKNVDFFFFNMKYKYISVKIYLCNIVDVNFL